MPNPTAESGAPTRVLVNPTPDDLKREQQRRHLHPLILEDLQGPRRRPKFTRFEHLLWLSVWDVVTRGEAEGMESDITLIFDTEELLIVQRGPAEGLRDLGAALDRPADTEPPTAIHDVCRTLQPPVADFVEASAKIETTLGDMESVTGQGPDQGFARLYTLKRQVVRVCRAASGIFEALRDASSDLDIATSSEPALRPYFQHLQDDAHGVAELAATQITTLDALAGLLTAQARA